VTHVIEEKVCLEELCEIECSLEVPFDSIRHPLPLCFALLCFALLCFALLCFALLCSFLRRANRKKKEKKGRKKHNIETCAVENVVLSCP